MSQGSDLASSCQSGYLDHRNGLKECFFQRQTFVEINLLYPLHRLELKIWTFYIYRLHSYNINTGHPKLGFA